jgi:hypothetical protein
MLEAVGFVDVAVGPRWDTFGGAAAEESARVYDTAGYGFLARKPSGAFRDR